MSVSSDNDKKLETRIEKTWATLDYRAEKWGVERIAYDGIQNHFPEDCGGTGYGVFFLQDNEWIDFQQYEPSKQVEEICFTDDGEGYDSIYTVLRHSSKTDRETQTGKFGEGLKMISAASLNHSEDIAFFSQNWSASPLAKKIYLPKEKKHIDTLCQKITTGLDRIEGSRTLFRNPSQELVEQVLSFKERIIDFRDDLPAREIVRLHGKHRVFRPKKGQNGELFVKRIKYSTAEPLYLSYQINGTKADSLLSPDRDHVIDYNLEQQIKEIITNLNDVELMKPLLDDSTPDFHEKNIAFDSIDSLRSPNKWIKAFHELYGDKAILAEKDKRKKNVNCDAATNGYKVVDSLSRGVHSLLKLAGVKVAGDCVDYRPKYEIIKPDELAESQRKIYELHRFVAPIIFGEQTSAKIHIFSSAYNNQGELTWFNGMSYWKEDDDNSDVYIRLDRLDSPTTFLSTLSHELTHTQTKAVDKTTEFEDGLTEALGNALTYILTNTKQ